MYRELVRVQSESRLRDIDQIRLFRFSMFSMKSEGLACNSTERFQLLLDYEHVFENLVRDVLLDLGQIDQFVIASRGLLTSCMMPPA
jgi:hypothetical protein